MTHNTPKAIAPRKQATRPHFYRSAHVEPPEFWERAQAAGMLRHYVRLREPMTWPVGVSPDPRGGLCIAAITTAVMVWMIDLGAAVESLEQRLKDALLLKAAGYSNVEIAEALGYCRRTIERQLEDALDQLTIVLLERGLITPFRADSRSL